MMEQSGELSSSCLNSHSVEASAVTGNPHRTNGLIKLALNYSSPACGSASESTLNISALYLYVNEY